MISIVNDGVSQGDGTAGRREVLIAWTTATMWNLIAQTSIDKLLSMRLGMHVTSGGLRFGSNMFMLFLRYLSLLAAHALPLASVYR